MKGDKITKEDPFVGEIELTEVGSANNHGMGIDMYRTVYTDPRGNYQILTTYSDGAFTNNQDNWEFISKPVAEIIGIDIWNKHNS